MTMDAYSMKDNAAKCSKCGKFMPWSRSKLVEVSDGTPLPSPVLVERGECEVCEDIHEC